MDPNNHCELAVIYNESTIPGQLATSDANPRVATLQPLESTLP